MELDGAHPNVEMVSDFGITEALPEEFQYFPFAPGERVWRETSRGVTAPR